MTTDELGLPIPWADLRQAFHIDGSLRDIVVVDTDLGDWERAYGYVRQLGAAADSRLESDPDPLPGTVLEVFALHDERSTRLEVHLGQVQLNCFFFGEMEIEFDLSPKAVASEAEARSILSFMRGLGRATGRPVHLTEENVHEWRWLTFEPASNGWEFKPEPLGERPTPRDGHRPQSR